MRKYVRTYIHTYIHYIHTYITYIHTTVLLSTIKSNRLIWLKYIYDNLRSQPRQIWKYLVSFMKKSSTSIQLEVDGTHLVEPWEVADAFVEHFQSA
jgi:hypothetical protein